MQPVPKRDTNLRLCSGGVSPAALQCAADACAGTPCPEWCGKVLQTRCTQTRESSAAGARRGPGELHAKENKKVRCCRVPRPCWSSAEEELIWCKSGKMMDFSGNSRAGGHTTHFHLPSAAHVMAPGLSTLISASSSSS